MEAVSVKLVVLPLLINNWKARGSSIALLLKDCTSNKKTLPIYSYTVFLVWYEMKRLKVEGTVKQPSVFCIFYILLAFLSDHRYFVTPYLVLCRNESLV